MKSSEITIYDVLSKNQRCKLQLRSVVKADQTVQTFISLYDVPGDSRGNLIGFWSSKTHWKNLISSATDIDLFAQDLVESLFKQDLSK